MSLFKPLLLNCAEQFNPMNDVPPFVVKRYINPVVAFRHVAELDQRKQLHVNRNVFNADFVAFIGTRVNQLWCKFRYQGQNKFYDWRCILHDSANFKSIVDNNRIVSVSWRFLKRRNVCVDVGEGRDKVADRRQHVETSRNCFQVARNVFRVIRVLLVDAF